MNRKEKEKLLLNALGLKTGDKLKVITNVGDSSYFEDFEITEKDEKFILEDKKITIDIGILLYHDFEKIIPEKIIPKKKIGDLICNECDCDKCPLCTSICGVTTSDVTLYDGLEKAKEDGVIDDRVYSLFKEILDGEVKEMEK